ncbi:hypothetical protein [Marinobacter sp. LV10MA510-1]|uniref:hypothetical protein n=1 Tax=Marinobacter sp. LV10MA510-1 TaxID=1415567 RepID=UPI000C01C3D8|nr:hypothetical protein [Marinobacter sp. LV10MA510-1]PFG07919.1 hypothetical protein ATI45_0130 [Marinobacter sp. LV10MA510-1]
MKKIKSFLLSKPRIFRQIQAIRRMESYSRYKPKVMKFDHDSIEGNFKISILSKSRYFQEYANTVLGAMKSIGIDVTLHENAHDIESAHAVLIVGGHTVDADAFKNLQKKYVLAAIQTEQICSHSQGAYKYAAYQLKRFRNYSNNIDLIFEWHRGNVDILENFHDSVCYVPHGGLTPKECVRRDNYDVAFIGNLEAVDGRRAKIVDQLRKKYKVFPKTSELWGAKKEEVFKESRIIINLHAESSSVFESPRFYEAISFGRMILSEPIFDSHPFKSPTHYVDVQTVSIQSALDHYLENNIERKEIENAATAIAAKHSISISTRKMVDAIMLRHYILTH